MDEENPSPWESAWFKFTDGEYYNRLRQIMLDAGMGEGDVETTLANVWELGWIAGNNAPKTEE